MSILDQLIRLADLRKSAGLTQNQMAGLIGTSQANVVRLEHAGKTISIEQVGDWLRGCGFPTLPNAAYLSALEAASRDRVGDFLLGADALLRAAGAAAGWHNKPVLAVVPNGFGDSRITVGALRDLLNGGDRPFCGLLTPHHRLSILFKHISERPADKQHTAYRLAQALRRSEFSAPLDSQEIARSDDGYEIAGGLIALESGSSGAAIVYLDHPILRLIDLFRPGFDFESGQALHDLDAVLRAEILLLCCGQRAVPSILTMVLARLARNPVSFVACPATVDLHQIRKEVQRDGSALVKLSLDARLSLDYSSSQALQTLAAAAIAADHAACRANRDLLDREVMHEPITPLPLSPRVLEMPNSGLGEMLDEQFAAAHLAESRHALLFAAFEIVCAFEDASKSGLVLDLPRAKYEEVLKRRRRKVQPEFSTGLRKAAPLALLTSKPLLEAIYTSWKACRI